MRMPLDISIQFSSHYKLHISVSDRRVLQTLKSYLETQDLITFMTRGKIKSLRQELQITSLWNEVSSNTISIDAGLLDYVNGGWLRYIDKTLYDINLSLNIPKVEPVTLLPKWEEILREDQKNDTTSLTKFYGGIAAQHTGYGKTNILIALAESLLPKRCLILVPSSGILKEIQERGEKYGVEIPQHIWKGELSILNPVGFLRSKEAKNQEGIQWLKDVTHVLTDEVHHIQCVSYNTMFSNYLPRVVRSYGFSASPDVKKGQELSPTAVTLKDLGFKNAKILGLSGSIRVRRKSLAKVSVVHVKTEITPITMKKYLKDLDWQDALDVSICRPFCAKVIKEIIVRFPEIKFYIPIGKIETGIRLYENLKDEGVSGIFWSEKTLLTDNESWNEKDNSLLFIKEHITNEKCRFLITTSIGFEGIDLPSLSGIIPLVGTSYRTTVQPAGRSMRGGSLLYVLLHDKYNFVLEKQMEKRLHWIIREYNNIEYMKAITIR